MNGLIDCLFDCYLWQDSKGNEDLHDKKSSFYPVLTGL